MAKAEAAAKRSPAPTTSGPASQKDYDELKKRVRTLEGEVKGLKGEVQELKRSI